MPRKLRGSGTLEKVQHAKGGQDCGIAQRGPRGTSGKSCETYEDHLHSGINYYLFKIGKGGYPGKSWSGGTSMQTRLSYGFESEPEISAKFLAKLTLKAKHAHIPA
jgi:hypothetical protein